MSPETGTDFCDVTVVVPAYRAAATIGRALDSIAAQKLKPLCVVVVDDGSDDDTAAAAEACAERMNGVALTVLRQANQGPGAARNRGVREADTRYVAFLDADDSWLPEKLARSMAILAEQPFVLVAHDMIVIDGDGRESVMDCARHHRRDDGFADLYKRGYVATSTVVAAREAILAAGGFDESLANAQDFDLWLKILTPETARFRVFPGAHTRHYRTAGSVQSFTDRRLRCTLELVVRHYHRLGPTAAWRVQAAAFRVFAVHFKALCAHAARRRFRALAFVLAGLPFRALDTALQVLCPPVQDHPGDGHGENVEYGRVKIAGFLVWSAVVLGGYYANNYGYYRHKFDVFFQYLLN